MSIASTVHGDLVVEGNVKGTSANGFIANKDMVDKKFRVEFGTYTKAASGNPGEEEQFTITFDTPFATVPVILLQDWTITGGVTPISRTTSGFTLEYNKDKNQEIFWVAIGEK